MERYTLLDDIMTAFTDGPSTGGNKVLHKYDVVIRDADAQAALDAEREKVADLAAQHERDRHYFTVMHGQFDQERRAFQQALDAERADSTAAKEVYWSTISDLQTQLAQRDARYQTLVKFYDDHVGTPCEQIRHKQEVDDLQTQLAQRDAAINTLNRLLRDKGLGQGEIDSLAADMDELTRLRELVADIKPYAASWLQETYGDAYVRGAAWKKWFPDDATQAATRESP